MKILRESVAEFVGTFFLLFCGVGSIIVNNLNNNLFGHIGICLAFGFVIFTMIYTCGHLSGAHFNPAVTIAFAVLKQIPIQKVFQYIASQLLGAISACYLLQIIFGNHVHLGVTLPLINGNLNIYSSVLMEYIFSFGLMFVIMCAAVDQKAEKSFAGATIGFTIFLGALIAGPVSGGSFNPARSLAPAIVSGDLSYLWMYILVPILGTVTGGLVYKSVFESLVKNINIEVEKSKKAA